MGALDAIFAEILENFNQKRTFLHFIRVKCAFLTCFCVFRAYIFAFYRLNAIKNCSIREKMQENHAKLLKKCCFSFKNTIKFCSIKNSV